MPALPDDLFWPLIDRARAATHATDASADPEALKRVIDALPTPDVFAFGLTFYEKLIALNTWHLWGAGYLLAGGLSDDGFHYFRSWIIGRGRSVYEVALQDPDALVECVRADDESGLQNELLEYVAMELLDARGVEADPRDDAEGFADDTPKGEPWREKDLPKLLPWIAARVRD
jgi:hypothetical protein